MFPFHLTKENPLSAIGVSVTSAPMGNSAEHFSGQSMPAGEDLTRPRCPAMFSIEINGFIIVKLAVISPPLTVHHVPIMGYKQPLDHPPNTKPASGYALRLRLPYCGVEHTGGQLIPIPATWPAPFTTTDNWDGLFPTVPT